MSSPATARRPEEYRLPRLAEVETGWLVCKRRPLVDLSPEQQQKIYDAYLVDNVHFVPENIYSLEVLGFYTDHTTASAIAKANGYILMSAPVNALNPETMGRYGIQEHPGSPAEQQFEATNPGASIVPHSELCKVEAVMARCCKLAESS